MVVCSLGDVEGLHVVESEKWKLEGLHAIDDVDGWMCI